MRWRPGSGIHIFIAYTLILFSAHGGFRVVLYLFLSSGGASVVLTVLYQDIVFNVQGTSFLVAPATYEYVVLLDNKQSIVLTID